MHLCLNMLAESFHIEQQARARAEALLADAADSYELAPDALCSCDLGSLQIVKCNPKLAEMFGALREQLLGRPLLSLLPSGAASSAKLALESLACLGVMPPIDLELRSPPDTLIATMTGARKCDAAGTPLRLLVTLRDVTRTRQLAAQLAQAQRLDALGHLAGGIAHDFNNLLLVISVTSELLVRQLTDRPSERKEAQLVHETASRAATLTADLLAFARKEPTPATQSVIDDVVMRDQPLLARFVGPGRQLVLRATAGEACALIAPSQLGQVLVNLVVNACDATADGGCISIGTRVRSLNALDLGEHPEAAPGDYVELTVSDTGTGMSEDVRARIFDPFFTTKPVGRGTGLGLSTVYGVVRQAHGHVSVRSELGLGTTFCVLLPVAGVGLARRTDAAVQRAVNATLLLVDDDDLVRGVTARILRGAGYTVLAADSGASAVDTMREHAAEIALVVSDVAMPGMDGTETLHALRAQRPDLPCVFVTGHAWLVERVCAMPRATVLRKPFGSDELLSAVQALLPA